MFVTSLLNFIPGYKMFMGIEKNSKENSGNKVSMEVGIILYVVTYYNPYFHGS